MADRIISKRLKGKVITLGYTGTPANNGNFGTERNTTTKTVSVRKQPGTKTTKRKEGRQEKNGGVKGRHGSAEEF